MTTAIPVIDVEAAEAGDRAQLDAVRTATRDLGAVQVVNHGVPQDLAADLSARMARLLARPRAEKAKLASSHPYRGWRQWPDDFGRLELERFNVAHFDDIEAARAAGVPAEYLGLYAHANLWPADDPGLRDAAYSYIEASRRLAERMLRLYAAAQGLPADAFGLGAVPHLRLTVNDYPTWTYPEGATDEDKLLRTGSRTTWPNTACDQVAAWRDGRRTWLSWRTAPQASRGARKGAERAGCVSWSRVA